MENELQHSCGEGLTLAVRPRSRSAVIRIRSLCERRNTSKRRALEFCEPRKLQFMGASLEHNGASRELHGSFMGASRSLGFLKIRSHCVRRNTPKPGAAASHPGGARDL